MKITILRNLSKRPEFTQRLLNERIGRIVARFGERIREVTISIKEKVIGEHGRPQASCSVACTLDHGGTIRVASRSTELLPAVAKVCRSLQEATGSHPRLGARKARR